VQGTSQRLVPLSASRQRKVVRSRTAAERNQRLNSTALNRNLNEPVQPTSTAPNKIPAKPAMSTTRTTCMRTAVARRSPQDERPAPMTASGLVRDLHCCEG
jgi:hypothetical protein